MYKEGLISIYCATCNDLLTLQWGLKRVKITIENMVYFEKKLLELPPFLSWEDNSTRIINSTICVWLFYTCIYDKLLHDLAWVKKHTPFGVTAIL